MSKIEALTYTRDLWLWLAENPGSHKSQWPGWETYPEERSPKTFHWCPLCDYSEMDCLLCPLFTRWLPEGKEDDNAPCCNPGSPYNIFVESGDTEDLRKAAQDIAQLCQEELDKLNKLEEKFKPLPYIEFEGQR